MATKNNDEIDLKGLAKKVLLVVAKKKKKFTLLLIGIFALSLIYFLKEVIKPTYISEMIVETRMLRNDQIQNMVSYYNQAIKNDDPLPDSILSMIDYNNLKKIESIQVKKDIQSADKEEDEKLFKVTFYHSSRPQKLDDVRLIIDDFKRMASEENDIGVLRQNTAQSILEIDSLIHTATEAGNNFKKNLGSPNSMVVLNDMYKSLNEILIRKSSLLIQQRLLESNNLLYKASPLVLSKKIDFPFVIFLIGGLLWFLICFCWVAGIIVFGED